MRLRAFALNCTLKASPEPSSVERLLDDLFGELRGLGVDCEQVRAADHDIRPGVTSDEGEGDDWPALREKVLAADIFVLATPIWLGHPSSFAQRVLERMDAMLSETDDEQRPVAYDRVAGFVVTGNEDGAHAVIANLAQALIDIGFTVPGQGWTYWNMGPGPGPSYTDTEHGHEWSESTGRTAAQNLVAVARALQANRIPAPPSSD